MDHDFIACLSSETLYLQCRKKDSQDIGSGVLRAEVSLADVTWRVAGPTGHTLKATLNRAWTGLFLREGGPKSSTVLRGVPGW